MAQWVVVSTELRVAVGLMVSSVIERTEMGDGRVRWLVACPEGAHQLIRLIPGVLSVDPAPPRKTLERLSHVA